MKYSVVIPAYNEEGAIASIAKEIKALPAGKDFEIIVVDDCSTDGTLAQAKAQTGMTVLSNVQNRGYGYSLKKGIMAAANDHIIILDADGSYPVSLLPALAREYERGFDMVVGARQGRQYQGSFVKRLGRFCFRVLSEFTTGRKIPDINSGFRIFRKDATLKFFHTLSSGFSFTTTITLAFMLNSYSVQYMPIEYHKRKGSSKVRYFRDTLRAAQIIVEAIVIYNPLKLFILCADVIVGAGVLAIIVALFAPAFVAYLIFLTITFATLAFAIGLVATLLKFMYAKLT